MKTNKVYRTVIQPLGLSICLGLTALASSTQTYAERIAVPLGQQGKAWNVETPVTGLRKDQVEQRFGMPLSKSGPVGDPPIYTWEYSNFSVYFEGEHVIHSVVKVNPEGQ